MSDIIEVEDRIRQISNPYVHTKSKLGSTTKLIDEKFVCGPSEVESLHDSMSEKLSFFKPTRLGFQYLISFTDNTQHENTYLDSLRDTISKTGKCTEKLIINWVVGHEHDGEENELSVTVRISNQVNGIAMLQAAMSSDHSEADELDLADGTVSVSVHGATQNVAEEIFSLVTRWASGCPQPQSITEVNRTIRKHQNKIATLNYWVFPLLFTACAFFFLETLSIEVIQPYVFLAFAGFMAIRTAAHEINHKVDRWCDYSDKFSLFMFTGGDGNQQTKITAKSKITSLKLIGSVLFSFSINVAAGVVVATYLVS